MGNDISHNIQVEPIQTDNWWMYYKTNLQFSTHFTIHNFLNPMFLLKILYKNPPCKPDLLNTFEWMDN